MLRLIIASFILVPLAVHADIYKCVVDGKTTFSQSPCSPAAQVVTPQYTKPSADNIATQQANAEKTRQNSAEIDRVERIQWLEREVVRLDDYITGANRARDLEVRQLEIAQLSSNNNLAGATRNQALATQMQAVISGWQSKIDTAQNERERYIKEHASLVAKAPKPQ